MASEAASDTDLTTALSTAGIDVIIVEPVEARGPNGTVIKGMWQKLSLWKLTQYERIVLLDSDEIVLKNIDSLMDIPLPAGHIAAGHTCTCNPRKFQRYPKDWTPQTCFFTTHPTPPKPVPVPSTSPPTHHFLNSGTLLLHPSLPEYIHLLHALTTHPNLSHLIFAEQDLLAQVYRHKWLQLPYTYNALNIMRSCHTGIWRDEEVRVVHYVLEKPWKGRVTRGKGGGVVGETHEWWWRAFGEVEGEWMGDCVKRGGWEGVVRGTVAG